MKEGDEFYSVVFVRFGEIDLFEDEDLTTAV